ncbi:SGNH/GDSL hydrolase family protein [Listeria newyorkensis]|uniref:SGNH/GDSL hydrolase family protein n=1 Tax=Listeria newyorkensis TaxID=1497681 RepID=A0A841YX73_9LIST|nr:SGNH/GDSL hydrolase family protein [Listeria newyorkensis]MBC1458020.1 SGNH/GDSL hydrolase family protein [Listeria newyorkensis]
MKRNKWVMVMTWISVLALLLCVAGLIAVAQGHTKSGNSTTEKTETKTETKKSDRFQVTGLGDSLTAGVGDTDGKGYVRRVVENLEKNGTSVTLSNLAISGARSNQLLSQLGQKEIAQQVTNADVIFMTIGGNDLFRGGAALEDLNAAEIQKNETVYLKNLEQTYKRIRELNKDAVVYHLGLYNPFVDVKNRAELASIAAKWNMDTQNLASKFSRVVYVPTYDYFILNGKNYLSSDHFHPNGAGYQLFADRVSSVMTTDGESDAK